MTDAYVPSWATPPRGREAPSIQPRPRPPGAPTEPSEYIPEWARPPEREEPTETSEPYTPPWAQPPSETPGPVNPPLRGASVTGSEEDPGTLSIIGSAVGSGFEKAKVQTSNLYEGLKSKAMGGTFFTPMQEPEPPPEVAEELAKPAWPNLFNPRWLGVQLGYGLASQAVPIAAAGVGTVVGGPVGGAAAFGLAGAGTSLLSHYQQAKKDGLSDHEAMVRAWELAILTGGIDAASVGAFGIPVTGALARSMAAKVVGEAAAPFTAEALAQLGVIQPALGEIGMYGEKAIRGEDITAHDFVNTYLTSAVVGGAQMGLVHAFSSSIRGGMRAFEGPTIPATPEELARAYQGLQRGVAGEPLDPNAPFVTQEPEVYGPHRFVIGADASTEDTPPGPVFYSAVARHIGAVKGGAMKGDQWLGYIRNAPGVKAEELQQLNLPLWLSSLDGKISKEDLLAYIEEHQVKVDEHWNVMGAMPVEGIEPGTAGGAYPQYQGYNLPGRRQGYGTLRFYWQPPEGEAPFFDPHFGDDVRDPMKGKNLMAWGRVTDRIDRDGKRGLFVEEIQSGLHQKGREQGYRQGPIGRGDLDIERISLRDAMKDDAFLEGIRDRHVYPWRDEHGVPRDAPITRYRLRRAPEATAAERAILGEAASSALDWSYRWDPRVTDAQIVEFARTEDDPYTVIGQENTRRRQGAPDAPFKSSWQGLVMKRLLRYAADNGYDRVVLTSGDQQTARWQGMDPQRARGLKYFYDNILPKELSHWAKKMGMQEGTTTLAPEVMKAELFRFRPSDQMRYAELNPAAASNIRVGLPYFSKETPSRVTMVAPTELGVTPGAALRPAANLIKDVAQRIVKKLGMKTDIQFMVHNGKHPNPRYLNAYGTMQPNPDGSITIHLPLGNHPNAETLYATAMHELGHAVKREFWDRVPDAQKLAIQAEYDKFKLQADELRRAGKSYAQVTSIRSDAVQAYYKNKMYRASQGKGDAEFPASSLNPDFWNYWSGFEEWMAENVARWATTDARPLSVVDRVFDALGKRIRQVVEYFAKHTGLNYEPNTLVKSWLEDLMKHGEPWASDAYDRVNFRSQLKAGQTLRADGTPEATPAPETLATQGGRTAMGKLPPTEGGEAMAVHADRFARWYNLWLSLPQVVMQNLHIPGLVRYGGLMRILNQRINTTMNQGLETLQAWRKLRGPSQRALGNLIRDYMLQTYRTADEVKRDVSRKPTQQEFMDLAQKHGVDAQGVQLFQRITGDLDSYLERYRNHMMDKAMVISDPVAQALRVENINKEVERMRAQPYFPMARFGEYMVIVNDPNGKVVRVEHADTAREQKQIQARLEGTLLPGERVRLDRLAKDVHPLVGLPPGLLDSIAEKMNMSSTQRAQLEQLKFDYTPARSFAHHFRQRTEMPGWSEDFVRAYAKYVFSFSRWMAKAELLDDMMDSMKQVRDSRKTLPNAMKRTQILDFMTDHYNSIMDPKNEFAALRGLLFHMYLGATPSSAILNLTQTLTSTYPFLAAKFGDFAAVRHMLRASGDLTTYYRKGRLTTETEGDLWMLGEGVRKGLISEGQSHNLGALTNMDNLSLGFGRTARERVLNNALQASSFMFEQTEQWNRRVAMRAAWRLALENPNAKYVRDSIAAHPLEYQAIIEQGRNPREAAAFVTAMDAVESTQYVYAPYGRPKVFRGKAGVLMAFKLFTQNTLFQMWNYPGARARSLLMFGALAGLSGLPGSEDLQGLIKGIGYRLFGKDWDVENEVRKFSVDVLNAQDCQNIKNINPICPDILLHGLSRHGFGIPQIADLLGHTIGLEKHVPYPSIDMSAAVGMGRILPFELERLLGPSKEQAGPIAESAQRAAGAGFGYGFALYRALSNQNLDVTDWKRWEGIMPRFLSNVSHAFRYYQEGMERNAQGNPILRFDPNETEQMYEVLARAAGFQPARLTQQWERVGAERDARVYWELNHDALVRQLWHARQRGDDEAFDRVMTAIRKYNDELPDEARGYRITSEALRQSFRQRAMGAAKQELGIPTQRRAIPLVQEIQRLYPGAEPIGRQLVE